jgi:hypothetical protein
MPAAATSSGGIHAVRTVASTGRSARSENPVQDEACGGRHRCRGRGRTRHGGGGTGRRRGSERRPQACSSSGGNFLAYIQGTQYDLTFCGPHTVTTAGTGPYVLIEDNAPNRIWFHQNANNSGWADCFRVQFASISLSGRDRNPGNIQVSANTAPC